MKASWRCRDRAGPLHREDILSAGREVGENGVGSGISWHAWCGEECGQEGVVMEGLECLPRVVGNIMGCFGNIRNINPGVYKIAWEAWTLTR